MEKEFKRVHKSYAPKAITENRPSLLQMVSQAEQGKKFETKINQVQAEETVKIAQLSEIEDIDDFDDLILEEFESGHIGNILLAREKKFGSRQSSRSKKPRPYQRVQNFAQAIRAKPKPGSQGQKPLLERWCSWCPGEPKHQIKDCPKSNKKKITGKVRQVEENEEHDDLESAADKIRASIGIN